MMISFDYESYSYKMLNGLPDCDSYQLRNGSAISGEKIVEGRLRKAVMGEQWKLGMIEIIYGIGSIVISTLMFSFSDWRWRE